MLCAKSMCFFVEQSVYLQFEAVQLHVVLYIIKKLHVLQSQCKVKDIDVFFSSFRVCGFRNDRYALLNQVPQKHLNMAVLKALEVLRLWTQETGKSVTRPPSQLILDSPRHQPDLLDKISYQGRLRIRETWAGALPYWGNDPKAGQEMV